MTLTVTGHPAAGAFVARTIDRAVRALAGALPAGLTFSVSPISAVDLLPGAQTQTAVQVAVYNTADPQHPYGYTIDVNVANADTGDFSARWLYFDDDPEHVRADGVTLKATVPPGFPCRVYYYHQNDGQARRFAFILSAQGAPSRVQVIDSFAGPSNDAMEVGHKGSRAFLLAKPSNGGEGDMEDLTPGEPFLLHDVAAKDGDVVNDVVGLRVLSGAAITVSVVAFGPEIDALAALETPRLPGDGHNRYGTFALEEYGRAQIAYAAGAPDATVSYGNREPTLPNVVPHDPGRDIGDYGVLHHIALNLSNPGAARADCPFETAFSEIRCAAASSSTAPSSNSAVRVDAEAAAESPPSPLRPGKCACSTFSR